MFCNNQKDDFWADFEGENFFSFEIVQNDTNRSAMTHFCPLYAAFANFGDNIRFLNSDFLDFVKAFDSLYCLS